MAKNTNTILVISNIKSQEEAARLSLIEQARYLAEDMIRMADRLEANPNYTVNELGEVQSRGNSVNTLCTKYMTLRRCREALVVASQLDQDEA